MKNKTFVSYSIFPSDFILNEPFICGAPLQADVRSKVIDTMWKYNFQNYKYPQDKWELVNHVKIENRADRNITKFYILKRGEDMALARVLGIPKYHLAKAKLRKIWE